MNEELYLKSLKQSINWAPDKIYPGDEDLVWTIDNNCNLLSVNNAYLQILNSYPTYSGDFDFVQNFGNNTDHNWGEYYQKALSGINFSLNEAIFDAASQKNIYWNISFSPIFGQHGQQTGVTCIAKYLPTAAIPGDGGPAELTFIGLMDSLVESDQKYKYLFGENPCPMFIWDINNLRILDCNKAALQKYGYSRDEFLRLNITDIQFIDDRWQLFKVGHEPNHDGLIAKQTWRQFKKTGELMFAEINGHLIEYRGRKIAFIQINDLTEKEKALEQLKESQAKLETATKIARLGYWQLKSDGSERYWSDEVYEIWGVTRDNFEVTFDTFLNTIHPEDRDAFVKEQTAFHSWKKTFDLEYRIILPDGSITWVYEKGKLLEDELGNPIIFQGMVQDITPQRLLMLSLEESNKRYEYVTKASFDAIWDWDLVNMTLFWGEGFQDIFGYDLKQTEPNINSWTKYIHPDDLRRVVTGIYEFIDGTGTIWQDEYRYQKADGVFAYVTDKGYVIRNKNGTGIRMVGVMQDISDRKKDEKELKSFADELYKRNKELHEFGYIVSHNLRSPIANIMGSVTLLEMDKDDQETIDQCVKDINFSINRLDEVIRDLSNILSITDGSAGWIKENIDVNEVLNNVHSDLKNAITQAGAVVQRPSGVFMCYSNKAYLYSVFFNLIGNAIKYRGERQLEINISIEQTFNSTTIKVADNGAGIDLNRYGGELFKPYKRFNTTPEGKGLGLFLVKSHVEALNGSIEVNSELGLGTTFTIVFPED